MRSSPLRLPSIEAQPGAADRLRYAAAGVADHLRRAAAGAACAWLLVLAAIACAACDQVLGLGQYTLACDAGNGGCSGSGGGGAGDPAAAR